MSLRSNVADFEKVEQALAAAQKPLTEADVAAATALPASTVDLAMRDALKTFEARLDVREDGSLVYDFGQKLKARGKRPWTYWLRKAGGWLWKGFTVFFKAWTAVMLVGYVIAFSVIILAGIIALSVAAEEDVGASAGIEAFFKLIASIFADFVTHGWLFYSAVDSHGYQHRRYTPKESAWKKKRKPEATPKQAKSFVSSVYDFIFGPERAPFDEGAQTREVISFVRENLGQLTISDVQGLSGFSRKEAESFFARFVGEFDGDVSFDEAGTLRATFPQLLESAGREQDEPIIHYWDEYEPPFEQTGNTAGRNWGIGALNTFNLVMSGLAMGVFGGLFGAATTGIGWGLGIVPFVFSLLFFAIPVGRAGVNAVRNHKQHQHNIRKRIFHAAFETDAPHVRVRDLLQHCNEDRTTEEVLKLDDIDDHLREMIEDLGGDLDVDDDGEIIVLLETLRNEQAVHRADRSLPAASEEEVVTVPQQEVVEVVH